MNTKPQECHLDVKQPSITAWQLATEQSGMDEATLTTCFSHGSVWLTRQSKKGVQTKRFYEKTKLLKKNQTLHIYCNEVTLQDCPLKATLIEDFGTFSLWFKPAGMLSQGSKFADHWSIHRWVQINHWPFRQCLITHRLDRFTSGIMIIAHDKTVNQQFHRLFEQRKIHKTYHAIVRGLFGQDECRVEQAIDGKTATSNIVKLDENADLDQTLLQIQPETGRKHQIRQHLKHLGLEVLNDRLYGSPPHDGDMQLQAVGLSFVSPDSGEQIEARVPTSLMIKLNA